MLAQDTKTFPKCHIGRKDKQNQQKVHTQVWIIQDTTESRVPRLNVHTNQIIVHTFSHGTFDSILSRVIHTCMCCFC